MKYAWIKQHRQQFPVAVCCRALRVSRSGYYGWLSRGPSQRQIDDRVFLQRIRFFHERARQSYGTRRIWLDLRDEGTACGKHRVARLRRDNHITTKRRRRFVITTRSKHHLWVAPNVLARDFRVARPNQVWVGDITFIQTRAGWLYLAVLLDLYARRVVGWSMSRRIDQALILDALDMAIAHRRPGRGLIHHSDRGSVYASHAYRNRLAGHQMRSSMSRTGDCWDNAVAESFFSTLKNELICGHVYANRDQARSAIFEYIEVFYNRQRRHSSAANCSPAQFEAMTCVS